MKYNKTKIAGSLLFIGSIQFILNVILSEVLYPGYNASSQTISSLGVGPSAVIFNSSILLLGIMGLIGVYFYHQILGLNLFSTLLGFAYIGAIGVGIFNEAPSTFSLHVVFSFIAYVFGGIAAIASYKEQKQPMSSFSVILGAFSLSAIIVLASGNYLGLGLGGIERMVAYPLLLWLVSLGSQLVIMNEG